MPTKHIHRVPVAEEFIKPIGEAVCVCQYLDSGLLNIGRRLTSTFYGDNQGCSSGALRQRLVNLVKEVRIDISLRADLLKLCDDADTVFKTRNGIVHSRAYTTAEGNQSRLYWNKHHAVNEYYNPTKIKAFTKDAANIACKANDLLHDPRMPN